MREVLTFLIFRARLEIFDNSYFKNFVPFRLNTFYARAPMANIPLEDSFADLIGKTHPRPCYSAVLAHD